MKITTGLEPIVHRIVIPSLVDRIVYGGPEQLVTVPFTASSAERTIWMIHFGERGGVGTTTTIAWNEPSIRKHGARLNLPWDTWGEGVRDLALQDELKRLGAPDDAKVDRRYDGLTFMEEIRITYWEVTL